MFSEEYPEFEEYALSKNEKEIQNPAQNEYLTDIETAEAYQIARSKSVQEILQGMIDILRGIEYDIIRLDEKVDNQVFSEIWERLRHAQTLLVAWRAKTSEKMI